jgi:hypothetical protein
MESRKVWENSLGTSHLNDAGLTRCLDEAALKT